ncbi:hypothetical protein ACFXJO_03625 [Streptomyces lavendulae]|uniref:hypothetical protein n=1 Tax=Streptomyces lavendulae TaxID=1914 RepID=UPI00368060B3
MNDICVHQDLATRSGSGQWSVWHRGAWGTGPTKAAALWNLIENALMEAEIAAEDHDPTEPPLSYTPAEHAAAIRADATAYARHHNIDLVQGRSEAHPGYFGDAEIDPDREPTADDLDPHGYCTGHDGCATCVTEAEREEAEEFGRISF